MKAITIKEPFASLIIEGIKEYEFRTWKTNYRGEILIHAGKSSDKDSLEKFRCYNLDYHKGYIIGKAILTDVIEITDDVRKKLKEKNELVYGNICRDKTKKYYAFKLENVEKLDPIEVSGKLSLWEYEK